MSASLILLVEDEASIAESLEFVLKREGFSVKWVSTGAEAESAIRGLNPQLIVLDINLPDISGFDLCRRIRQKSSIPILFLTSRQEEVDRIVGFELGADDYVTKPFSPREVASRIRAILRRGSTNEKNNKKMQGDFVVDDERKLITFKGVELELPRYEYLLLRFLIANPGRVYSREALMNRIWESPEMSLERTVDTHIKTIRQKLRQIDSDADIIKTHRGFGYSLEEQ